MTMPTREELELFLEHINSTIALLDMAGVREKAKMFRYGKYLAEAVLTAEWRENMKKQLYENKLNEEESPKMPPNRKLKVFVKVTQLRRGRPSDSI